MVPYHFLLTRYNIGLYSPNNAYAAKLAKMGMTPDQWMEHRIGLFHTMASSVQNQTVHPDEWVIFTDPNTPDHFLAEIEACIPGGHGWTGITPVTSLIPGNFTLPQEVHDWAKAPIITSRCDNDDTLFPDYIATVQMLARQITDNTDTMIDSRGITRDANGKVTEPVWCGRPVSMFISLVEFGPQIRTVLCEQHPRLHHRYRAIYTDQRLWQINLHGKNLVNTARG